MHVCMMNISFDKQGDSRSRVEDGRSMTGQSGVGNSVRTVPGSIVYNL